LFGASEGKLAALVENLQRAEDPKLHGLLPLAPL
jgi:hypothetical protein